MGSSARKRLQAIYRLVNDVCQLGNDPQLWTDRLMRGLAELFEARIIALTCGSIPTDPNMTQRIQVQLHRGFTPQEEALWCKHFCAPDQTFESVYLRRMLNVRARFVTIRRQDVMSDEEFYALPEVQNVCKPCNVDQHVISWFTSLSLHRMFAISAHRAWGEPELTIENRREMRTLHLELARAWRHRIAAEAQKDAAIERLPDRLRQVLWLLCLGRSEKEIADQLQLSKHTVHNHVTRLHQELAVNSRGELLARALTGGGTPPVAIPGREMNQFRPAWQ